MLEFIKKALWRKKQPAEWRHVSYFLNKKAFQIQHEISGVGMWKLMSGKCFPDGNVFLLEENCE